MTEKSFLQSLHENNYQKIYDDKQFFNQWMSAHKNYNDTLEKSSYPAGCYFGYSDSKIATCYSLYHPNEIKYLHSSLNIIRVNSLMDIPVGVKEYIDKIITTGDLPYSSKFSFYNNKADGLSDIHPDDNNEKYPFWMSTLKKFVPIFLVNEKEMPDIKVPEDKNADGDRDALKKQINLIKALGCYFSKGDGQFCPNRPCIYLCPERIKEMTDGLYDENNNQITLSKELKFAVVLIHELGHAIIDTTNYPAENVNAQGDVCIMPNKNMTCLMDQDYSKNIDYFIEEEKCANRIMLNYMERWYNLEKMRYKDMDMIKAFIKKQPIGYNKAVDADEDCWREWWNIKNNNTK